MTFILTAVTVALAAPAYPTTWRVRNATPVELRLSCTGRAEGVAPLRMATGPLAPGRDHVHAWTGVHNDGMGLNPATWTCMVGTQAVGVFKTAWGEPVELTVLGDRLHRLEKRSPTGDVANR